MEIFGEIVKGLFDMSKEIWMALYPMAKTAIMFTLWVLAAVLIIPCVYVSNSFYPVWEKWSEKF